MVLTVGIAPTYQELQSCANLSQLSEVWQEVEESNPQRSSRWPGFQGQFATLALPPI